MYCSYAVAVVLLAFNLSGNPGGNTIRTTFLCACCWSVETA